MHSSTYSPSKINKYRKKFRQDNSGYYNGYLHFSSTLILTLGFSIIIFFQLNNPKFTELILLPLSFILANLTEYIFHRFPMHNRVPLLDKLFHNHTTLHHYLFTDDDMELERVNDVKMALLKPLLLLILTCGLIFPVTLSLYYLYSMNGALIFAETTLFYMGLYECFHLFYHLPKESRILKIPIIQYLQSKHALHHKLDQMKEVNFNIFFPFFDFIFGTSTLSQTD